MTTLVESSGTDDVVQMLKRLMIERSLPLWASKGWDGKSGGFVERLDRDGRPDDGAIRRVRVQARQIYCFAKAAQLDWYPAGEQLALDGLDHLLTKARSHDGEGFVHLLTPLGEVADARCDTYDQAFVLLALANVYQLRQDAQVLAEMQRLLAFIDRKLRSTNGGFVEGVPASLPRRQNPQMHLFEAMIAAFDATQDAKFQDRAGELFMLFTANLYDKESQTLGEYFEDDWSRILPASVEPGHQAEWVWLLKGFERITGCPTKNYRSGLLNSALRFRDVSTGCLIDEGDAAGNVIKSTRRLWPQTEIAKAWIAQAEAGDFGAREQSLDALLRMHKFYLCHPVAGGWYDQFDADGVSLVDFIPASSFYHVLCAVAEAVKLFETG